MWVRPSSADTLAITMFESHKRVLALALGTTAFLAAAGAADAQRGRQRAPEPASQSRDQPGQTRGSNLYSVLPGHRGIITSSTPNESGNLGGPSAGGGGGGGSP